MYGESLSTIQSEQERKCFMQMSMTSESYYRFWKSLGGSRNTALHGNISGRWTSTACDTSASLTSVESSCAAFNRSILSAACNVFALDDDHLRMRSRSVTDTTALRSINNPQKALGPIQNAIARPLTSCFIVGHHTHKGETVRDI